MAYPPPTPVVKGKAAEKLIEEMERTDKNSHMHSKWKGSREVYEALKPKIKGA
jgi:hypothetical protein